MIHSRSSLIGLWDWHSTMARQYDQAIEQERKTLELDPNYLDALHTSRPWPISKNPCIRKASRSLKRSWRSPLPTLVALSGLGYAYAVAGRRAEAQKVLDKLNELSKQKYVPAVCRARIYAGLGEKDKAFEWLEKAYEDRSIVVLAFIKVRPNLRSAALGPALRRPAPPHEPSAMIGKSFSFQSCVLTNGMRCSRRREANEDSKG